jgi:hypothetical protein
MLGVVVRELSGFASPRTFQDIVHVQIDTGENLINLVISRLGRLRACRRSQYCH